MRKKYLIAVELGLVCIALLLISACSNSSHAKTSSEEAGLLVDEANLEMPQKISVYFSNEENYLVPITYSLDKVEDRQIKNLIKIAVDKIIEGPQGEFLLQTIPEGTLLRDWCVSKGTAILDFSQDFLRMNEVETRLAINSLCLTLGNLPTIENVQILIEGQVVKEMQGIDTELPMTKRYANYRGDTEPEAVYNVYFGDINGMYMIPMAFASRDDDALPERAVEKLLQGPGEEKLVPTVWPGTALLNFEIEEGTAHIDLNSRVKEYGGGSANEKLLLNSLL
ncbi:MAG: hypothetical protein GX318_03530, partial [Clostridia bacterium]|nr:hypothetical protein [Clostridia bacterium]